MKNELSRAMASADVKVRYDTQCKRVLSQKEILARILARTVKEFAGMSVEEIILDRKNSGVTQLLEYMGEEETEMYVRSAGLHPSGKIEKWVLDILMKEDDITRYQCSSPIEELCKYDYLIPIGIYLDERAYPFQRIYEKYQDFDKKQISREEAKEMICQIEENLKKL